MPLPRRLPTPKNQRFTTHEITVELTVVYTRTTSFKPATESSPAEYDDERTLKSAEIDGERLKPAELQAFSAIFQRLLDEAHPEDDLDPGSDIEYDPSED